MNTLEVLTTKPGAVPMHHQQGFFESTPFGWRAYQNHTVLHPLAVTALVFAGLLTLLLPRRHALVPAIFIVCFISQAQRLVVLGLDFTILRLLIITGWTRVLFRGEYNGFRWQTPDTIMVLWALVNLGAYSLLRGTGEAAVYITGAMYEALGLYFLIRCLIRSWSDLEDWLTALVPICAVVAVFFLNEKATGHNMFSIFGGLPEITAIREGRIRCRGAFPHAILAGCFWASLAPLIGALWWKADGRGRILSIIGIVSCSVIIVTCASSTPVMAIFAAIFGALMYHFRNSLRHFVWLFMVLLVVLHFSMKAPVWHLVARIDLAGGSTGWHRFNLIDQAIRRLPEWALLGIESTAHWGWGLSDITNQFILEGAHAGILGLGLFVTMIWMCFSAVGRLWREAAPNSARVAIAWGLGVSLFVHTTSFIGVSYFGQVSFGWYITLGAIVSLSEPVTPSVNTSRWA